MRDGIKIISGALDESPTGDIILRGVIDHESLKHILYDDYQREALPLKSLKSLIDAYKANKQVPDVTLGMRGGDFLERDGSFYLRDDVYGIDGLQRISAALHVMRTTDNLSPRVGATVTFNTNKDQEMEMFRILNVEKVKLSPNVLIRNLRESVPVVEMMFALCADRDFVLYDRVCWQQRMKRNELISAFTMLKANGLLHSAFGPGSSCHYHEAAETQSKTMLTLVGRKIMMNNLKLFFDIVNTCWGIKNVSFKEGAMHLKSGFLVPLAAFFSRYQNFWDADHRLVITADWRKKLSTFPINDPTVVRSIGNSNINRVHLVTLIAEYMNSSKKTRRLVAFKQADTCPGKAMVA